MNGDSHPDQLVTFARGRHQTLPINYRDLSPAASNQTGAFQLVGSFGDGWPLDAQHFGEQALRDPQCFIITAVMHHEQPTRQPLLEPVRTVARYRHKDLLKKGLDISVHETLE